MANNRYNIQMTKKEMIKYYANKIINDSLLKCSNNNSCFVSNIITKEEIIENLEDIAREIEESEKVVKVETNKILNVIDIGFYVDYCPRYYVEDKMIEDRDGYDFLNRFIFFLKKINYLGNMTNTRDVIMKCIEHECPEDKDVGTMYDVLSIALNKSGFIDKYIDGFTVPVNESNLQELIENMEEIQKEIKKSIENGEIENG